MSRIRAISKDEFQMFLDCGESLLQFFDHGTYHTFVRVPYSREIVAVYGRSRFYEGRQRPEAGFCSLEPDCGLEFMGFYNRLTRKLYAAGRISRMFKIPSIPLDKVQDDYYFRLSRMVAATLEQDAGAVFHEAGALELERMATQLAESAFHRGLRGVPLKPVIRKAGAADMDKLAAFLSNPEGVLRQDADAYIAQEPEYLGKLYEATLLAGKKLKAFLADPGSVPQRHLVIEQAIAGYSIVRLSIERGGEEVEFIVRASKLCNQQVLKLDGIMLSRRELQKYTECYGVQDYTLTANEILRITHRGREIYSREELNA